MLINQVCIEPDALDALDTLVWLSHEDDAETRWYGLYALVNDVAGADPQILGRTVAERLDDPDDQVRDLAREHHHPGRCS